MNHIATTAPNGRLPSRAPRLVLSPRLGYLADDFAARGALALPEEVAPDLRMEAERAIEELERSCAPAPESAIEQWMNLVAAGVANTPDERTRFARIGLVCSTSGDLPRACWTAETRADFARRGGSSGFWPSDSEVDAFLRPIGVSLHARLRALKAIRDKGLAADQGGSERSPGGPTEAEQAAVAGILASWRRERTETRQPDADDGRPALRPWKPETDGMSPEQRRAWRKARGLKIVEPERAEPSAPRPSRRAQADAEFGPLPPEPEPIAAEPEGDPLDELLPEDVG